MSTATISKEQREDLLNALKVRFEKNMKRHEGLEWSDLKARLIRRSGALWSLSEMERTGGEPDVIGRDKDTGEYVFCDCSAESPRAAETFATTVKGRRKGRRKACL